MVAKGVSGRFFQPSASAGRMKMSAQKANGGVGGVKDWILEATQLLRQDVCPFVRLRASNQRPVSSK